MLVFNVRNVNHAFPLEINSIKHHGIPRKSRAGDVLEFPYPVATTYSNPMERVLFDRSRMANPFFHFFEGLWIIAGCNDVSSISYFNEGMRQYSDDGGTFHGAYGYRLRHEFGIDQIQTAINKLRANPEDRRVVVSMWKPDLDIHGGKRDHPCNTHIYFKIRDSKLHMTVCCRSNDLLYGKLGANVVHMSMLQEYMAGMIGVSIGPYTQVSDSLHVYTDLPLWATVRGATSYVPNDPYTAELPELLVAPYSMFGDDEECDGDWNYDLVSYMTNPFHNQSYKTPFFEFVAKPMAQCWQAHKENREGNEVVEYIEASDWRSACKNWLSIKEAV